jgi:hypothetical protein
MLPCLQRTWTGSSALCFRPPASDGPRITPFARYALGRQSHNTQVGISMRARTPTHPWRRVAPILKGSPIDGVGSVYARSPAVGAVQAVRRPDWGAGPSTTRSCEQRCRWRDESPNGASTLGLDGALVEGGECELPLPRSGRRPMERGGSDTVPVCPAPSRPAEGSAALASRPVTLRVDDNLKFTSSHPPVGQGTDVTRSATLLDQRPYSRLIER